MTFLPFNPVFLKTRVSLVLTDILKPFEISCVLVLQCLLQFGSRHVLSKRPYIALVLRRIENLLWE